MAGRVDQATQTAAIARVNEFASLAPTIREELQRILTSSAFANSHRSQRFLTHIVEHALEGHFDQIKERSIGVELFARPASYDTNEDSIVRVTATDVRKRLTDYYSGQGRGSRVSIGLPQGSYIPEFRVLPELEAQASQPATARSPFLLPLVFACAILGSFVLFLLWQNAGMRSAQVATPFPWSLLFTKDRRTYLVTADTSFAALQDLLKQRIPLSDYASRNYPPKGTEIRPESRDAANLLMRNQFTATADAEIAAEVARLARGSPFVVTSAKSMQIRSFKTADNFILTGSSYANPWVELFRDHIGLSIEFEPSYQKQVCRDRKAQAGQASEYVPTALTGGAGQAYATITLLRNPGQDGWVLLLAGTNMEGTAAAADIATDAARLGPILAKASIDAASRHPFEILLKLNSMAGSASTSEVVLARLLR